jgi:hypothetical protein
MSMCWWCKVRPAFPGDTLCLRCWGCKSAGLERDECLEDDDGEGVQMGQANTGTVASVEAHQAGDDLSPSRQGTGRQQGDDPATGGSDAEASELVDVDQITLLDVIEGALTVCRMNPSLDEGPFIANVVRDLVADWIYQAGVVDGHEDEFPGAMKLWRTDWLRDRWLAHTED